MRLSLFGAITITAPNLPYALVLLSWALNTSWSAVVGDLLGIAVGHIYYFFVYIWRHEVSSDRRCAGVPSHGLETKRREEKASSSQSGH